MTARIRYHEYLSQNHIEIVAPVEQSVNEDDLFNSNYFVYKVKFDYVLNLDYIQPSIIEKEQAMLLKWFFDEEQSELHHRIQILDQEQVDRSIDEESLVVKSKLILRAGDKVVYHKSSLRKTAKGYVVNNLKQNDGTINPSLRALIIPVSEQEYVYFTQAWDPPSVYLRLEKCQTFIVGLDIVYKVCLGEYEITLNIMC